MREYNGKTYKECACNGKVRAVHRVVAEKALGRPLRPTEPIHHLNGGIDGPIAICQDKAYHNIIHARIRAYNATGNPNKRKCQFCLQWDFIINMKKGRTSFFHRSCATAYELNRQHKKKEKKNEI